MGVTCEVCELLMKKLNTMLKVKGGKTKKVVKDALNKLCDDIPWSKQCKKLVNTYSEQIFKMIVDEFKDTDKICAGLYLCSTPKNDVVMVKPVEKAVTCDVCELLMKKLNNQLKVKGGKTKKVVEDALDKLCNDIPWFK